MPRIAGPWSSTEIEHHLDTSVIPMRLAFKAGAWPVVVSLWYLHRDGALWCAMHETSRACRRLEQDPRCAFEVASDGVPYRGVRGRGRATLDPGAGGALLRELLLRYLGSDTTEFGRWLLGRGGVEYAVRIVPSTLASWDYTSRMSAG